MTWQEILRKGEVFLAAKGVEEATLAVELLAARLLGCGRGTLPMVLAGEVLPAQLEAMRRGLRRLVAGEPIQYVLGEWDFRRLTLRCDRRALIPRPETEELVTRVLTFLRSEQCPSSRPMIIDVGTGTGAIALALADELASEAMILGTDVSEAAIALARENAQRCALTSRVHLVVMDGLDELTEQLSHLDEPRVVDVLVANPPYVERAQCELLERRVRDWEPRLALDGGPTGLDFYDRYLGDAFHILRPGGAVFFEIGENQGAAVAQLMTDYGMSQIRIEKDFAGHDRYASARLF